jgi:phosphohistidine phosphatase SixA
MASGTAWFGWTVVAVVLAAAAQPGHAGERLIEALRSGGFNIYFRHAQTNWGQGDNVEGAGDWTSCDPSDMRQLSSEGRATARRLGNAIRQLHIPVVEVLSSPYCRAAETARLMEFGPVQTTRAIMNTRAQDYVGGRDAVVRRAREILSTPPPRDGNRVVIGHGNLMLATIGVRPSEAGSLVFMPRPGSDEGFELVGRLSVEDWQKLADSLATDNATLPAQRSGEQFRPVGGD